MSFEFHAVARAVKAAVTGKSTEIDPEFMANIGEAWTWAEQNSGSDIGTTFADKAAAERFARLALALCKREETPFGFRRLNMTQAKYTSMYGEKAGEMPEGYLVFRLTSKVTLAKEKAERAAYKADLDARRARGEVTRGRKPKAASVAAVAA